MKSLTKLLCIGLDSGDKDLILQWAEEGSLPTLQRLLKEGAWGITENPSGLYVGAVWPSFYTSASPAEHSRYCFRQIIPGTYDTPKFLPMDVKKPPFWDALSRDNKKVAVVDVPKTFPSADLNGIHIVDWGAHDPYKFDTWPPHLAHEVVKRFGQDTIGNCNAYRNTPSDFNGFCESLKKRAAKKTDLVTYFLDQGGWDCFVTVYSESHCVGHQCWHLRDPQHPRHDPAVSRVTGDLIKEVYIALDLEIAKLLERVGPDTMVMIFASHGIGPHYDGTFLLDEILQRLQGIQLPQPYLSKVVKRARRPWSKLPFSFRRLARPFTSMVKTRVEPKPSLFHKLKYFCIPNNDVYGGIRINLKGREPQGIINSGAQFERTCQELAEDLLNFTNLETEDCVVRRVLRTSDLYQGKYLDNLPDLLVEWNRNAPISKIYSPKTGIIEGEYTKCRTGDHKPNGMFFLYGPGVKAGKVSRSVSVMDFAPTIAEFLEASLGPVEGNSILPHVLRAPIPTPNTT